MKRLLWNKPDGSCVTTIFPPEFNKEAKRLNISPAKLLEDTIVKIKLEREDLRNLTPVQVNETAIDDPQGFGREVWDHNAKFNIPKARNIVRNKLRAEREIHWKEVDDMFRDAMDSGTEADKTAWRVKRQKFRDVTTHQSILDADTPDALKLIAFDNLVR